jgi:8-oxo-dGDP phosphatase
VTANQAPDFRRLSSDPIYVGRVFTLSQEIFESPTGLQFDRQIVRHNGAVAVVPLHDDGTVTLIVQYRPALGMRIYEVPAGLCDRPGEPKDEAARRELQEEVGLAAATLDLLGDCTPAPGLTDERITMFVARGLTDIGAAADGPEEDDLVIHRIPMGEALAMIDRGVIIDGKTVIALLRADRLLRRS